ncbi:MAG: peptidase S41, partial [Clostridia bacterium]|nr:peptidase S41 [Clostridia bacterium]
MSKKISLGAVIALMAITAAITVSITYTVAMKVFNQRVYSVTERQNMYDKLSEIDRKMRQYYYGDIDEEKLRTLLAEGYVSGIGDDHCRYL